MSSHIFDPTILRKYDIRGVVGKTLNPHDAWFIGAGFGQIIRTTSKGDIAVGRDGRLTSAELAEALIEGLVWAGCHVSDIGVGPTPMLYFADRFLNCDGAIQVTGSHNPPSHNGFKIVQNHRSFFDTDILDLARLCATGLTARPDGQTRQADIFSDYIDRIMQAADFGDSKIIWDAGNGAAGPAIEAIIKRTTGTHHGLFTEIDGTFPNHHPNPVDPKTLAILKQAVLEAGADCGIGFDGDGDRIGVVDAKGRHIAGDILTAYLSLDVLERKPGSDIIFDVKSSNSAMKLVRDAGGKPHLWKTGHSHMKTRLREMNAPLAGEMSGHIFIADDYYGFDDALFVAIRLIRVMRRMHVQTGMGLTDFIDQLPPSFTTPECHIACPDEQKFTIMEKLSEQMLAQMPDDQLNFTDGIRLTTEKGWCLIRASNTEGALVIRAEGEDEESLSQFVQLIKANLIQVGLEWNGP